MRRCRFRYYSDLFSYFAFLVAHKSSHGKSEKTDDNDGVGGYVDNGNNDGKVVQSSPNIQYIYYLRFGDWKYVRICERDD